MKTKFETLLNDFGYRLEGKTLIRKGIRGYTRDKIVGQRRDVFDAVESLVYIVCDKEYTERYLKLTHVKHGD